MKILGGRKAPLVQQFGRLSYPRYLFPAIILLVAGVLGLVWVVFTTPGLADGWEYQVYASELDEVSALALDGRGGMFVTLEKRHGEGQLVHLKEGQVVRLLDGMNKPDGLLRRGERLYITNEAGEHGLFEYSQGLLRPIDGVVGGEGIAPAGANQLLVIEDRKTDGRLMRIDERSGAIEVLLSGLNEAEGVCQDRSGDIYFVEKTASVLSRYRNGEVAIAYEGLVKPAFLNCLADGTILITEDRTNFGRLLRYKNGDLEVLASRLHSPQTVIVDGDGVLYLAEQRKKRILRINRSGN